MDRYHHNARRASLAAPEVAHVNPAGLAPLGPDAAPPAGLSPPGKDDAPRLAGAEGIRGQGKADGPDCADHLTGAQPADSKRFTTLAARLALADWALTRTNTNNNTTTASRVQVHPLLFDACRCGSAGRPRCLACWRWFKHYSAVMQRRKAWGAAR